MTGLNIWEPLRDGMTLREAVNRLFEDSIVRPEMITKSMPMDVLETTDALTIKVSLPGCTKESIDLNFQKDTLTVKATVNNGGTDNGKAPEGQRYLLRERFTGLLTRSLTLPIPVNVEAAKAQFQNGVLVLTLPKAESVKPRSIQVQD